MLGPVGRDRSADVIRDTLIKTVARLPEALRGTLTWDQGCEMSEHHSFTVATNMDVYFCEPASPWQRGSNENTNGLLRQYFPKGLDLSRQSVITSRQSPTTSTPGHESRSTGRHRRNDLLLY